MFGDLEFASLDDLRLLLYFTPVLANMRPKEVAIGCRSMLCSSADLPSRMRRRAQSARPLAASRH